MYLLLILIIGTAIGYDPRCPVQQEWRLRANVSCFTEDKYVCLFNLLKKKYQADCSGSSQSRKGSKLVFQPVFNLAECNHGRYQPIVFTTYRNSECIFFKSKCNEEGQTVYRNGSSSNDIACGCDFAQGYSFVFKPKNSCFCIPSEEDCTCFKVECRKLSTDYQCITDEDMISNTKCHEVYPQISFNQRNRTEHTINGSIQGYSNANNVTFIIIALLAAYSGVVVIAVVIVNVRENKDRKLESARDDDCKRHQFIRELILKGECGKHHFARIVFIGKHGVGKTSLMRRLLWQNKEEITCTESTDGIEVERCNINIRNGKWSPCDKIDHDLARLIQQVYTERTENEHEASEQNIEHSSFKQNFTSNDSKAGFKQALVLQGKMTNCDQMEVSTQSSHDKTDQIEVNESRYNVGTSNITENSSDIDDKFVDEIKRENINYTIDDSNENVKTRESEPRQDTGETNIFKRFEDSFMTSDEVGNERGIQNDENIVPMTNSIIQSCLYRNANDAHDMLAFCALWDFAGQKDFYATHQVFLSKCAVFLLVTDSLEFSCAEKLWIDFQETAQYVRFWFDAIHCYWSNPRENRLDPPIIVVCTNEDKIQDPNKRVIRQQKFKKNLIHILNQKQREHLRNIHFVSNTEDNDFVFQEIRKEISSHAMAMKDWGRHCPLKWLLFQQVLVRLKDSQMPIITTTKLLTIAKHDSIGINNDEEFKRCLQYFHDIGTVIYFDEDILKDHVILDSKWLIDAFRCLVTDKIGFYIEISNDWQTLRETGELTPELISILFKKEPKLKFTENKKHLLEVMKRFDIIVKLFDSNALYMPCMMESCSFNKVKNKLMNKNQTVNITSWLCLEFEFLPPGFFNHILAWYIKNYPVSAIFDKGTRTNRKALYRQIGVFDLDYSRCQQLVVCEGPNVIALQVWDTRMSGQQFGDLATSLFDFLKTIENRYSLKISYEKSFKCKHGDFNINRRRLNELITEVYRCLEHSTNHVSADLVQPWGFMDNLRREIRIKGISREFDQSSTSEFKV